jgi:predicted GNAT family acetyltransferase
VAAIPPRRAGAPLTWFIAFDDRPTMDDITFFNNQDRHQFELRRGGAVAARAEYKQQPGAIVFTHTEVLPAFEGKGLASKLAKLALEDVRKRGLKAVPRCEFIASYIERHPEYADLVGTDSRAG